MSPVNDLDSSRTQVEQSASQSPGDRPAPPDADLATEVAALAALLAEVVEDFGARKYLAGVVALRGGTTSHAAVVAKGLGLPMIAGLRDAVLDCASEVLRIGGRTISRLDVVTVDGSQGHLHPASATVPDGSMTPALAELIGWADQSRDRYRWPGSAPVAPR